MENCQHGNFAPIDTLASLAGSQAGLGRHKCAVCAYQGGFRLGIQGVFTEIPVFERHCNHGRTAPEYLLRELPLSQAGTGRHKCVICAFHDGLVDSMGLETVGIVIEKKVPVAKKKGLRQVKIPTPGENPFPKRKRTFTPRKHVDYPKIQAERTNLGLLGEQLVIEHEIKLLTDMGLADLAAKIEHTSVLKGDGAGYDILSFDANGENKYIEVKTTVGSIDTTFFMSANELEFSKQYSQNYCLYRVFNVNEQEKTGEFYLFQGDISNDFHFSPYIFEVAR